jgi:predicted O-methyltransferase YrrM
MAQRRALPSERYDPARVLKLDGVTPPRPKSGARRAVSFLKPYLIGLAGSAYLFTIGWTRLRNRAAIVELGHHFGYRHESREKDELPLVALSALAQESMALDIREIDAVDGNLSERELIAVCRLIRASHPKALFEFGTFDGRTTLNMVANSGPASKVYTLDLPRGGAAATLAPIHRDEVQYATRQASGERFRGTDAERSIVQLEGDSGTFDFSPFEGGMDFILIDASHTFEYVINDSLHAIEMLEPGGGTIVWHDYGRWDGVTAALNELRRVHPAFEDVVHVAGTTLAVLRIPAT